MWLVHAVRCVVPFPAILLPVLLPSFNCWGVYAGDVATSTATGAGSTAASPSAVADAAAAGGNQTAGADTANFGDTINVLGQMERTDQDFSDGLALDLLSPKNRTLVVKQNKSPLSGTFVTGSSGEPFMALANYSYVVTMNETSRDLIAKIEVPYDPNALEVMGVDPANTYVGTLSADQKSWVVSESQRNVHVTENKTRIIKMTSLDGEYILLGRKIGDISNIFVQFGQGATRTVNVTGGEGKQEAEFIDGLRLSIESNQSFTLNADIKDGVDQNTLPAETKSLNSYAWVVNTTIPDSGVKAAELRVPFNRMMLVDMLPGGSSPTGQLKVAKRPLNDQGGKFQPLNADRQQVRELTEDRIKVPEVTQLDGEYVVLVSNPSSSCQHQKQR